MEPTRLHSRMLRHRSYHARADACADARTDAAAVSSLSTPPDVERLQEFVAPPSRAALYLLSLLFAPWGPPNMMTS